MSNNTLEKLIESCDQCFDKVKEQKLKNVRVLDKNLVQLNEVYSEIFKIQIIEIGWVSSFANFPQLVGVVLELYRILLLQDEDQVKQIQSQSIKLNNNININMPLLSADSKGEIKKLLSTLYEDLNDFDIYSVNQQALNCLNQFENSQNNNAIIDKISQISSVCGHLFQFVISIKSFCEQFQGLKSEISLEYDHLEDCMQNLEAFLDQSQSEQIEVEEQLLANNKNDQSQVEEFTNKIFESIKNKFEVQGFNSNFIGFYTWNFNIREWIKNQRPLIFWKLLDQMRNFWKWQELIYYYCYQSGEQKINLIENNQKIGFDFLFLMKKSEISQIKQLKIDVNLPKDIKKITQNLKYLPHLALKHLELNNKFLLEVCQSKELVSQLISFLDTQQQIESLQLVYYSTENIDNFQEIIKSIQKLSNLKQLAVIFDQLTEIQNTKIIVDAISSLPILEQLKISLNVREDDVKNRNLLENLCFPKSLRILHLIINQGFEIQSKYIASFILGLQNLQQFTMTFQEQLRREHTQGFNQILDAIKKSSLVKVGFQFQYQQYYYQTKRLLQLYKFKQLVEVLSFPNIRYQLNRQE